MSPVGTSETCGDEERKSAYVGNLLKFGYVLGVSSLFQKGHSKADTLLSGKPRSDAFKVIAVGEHRGEGKRSFTRR
jgi:hypothetical protein